MNKKNYLIILIITIAFSAYAENNKKNTDFRFIADFNAYPYFYEFSNKTDSHSFNGSLFFGAKIGKFSTGAEIHESYLTQTAKNDGNNYKGAWNMLSFTLNLYIEPAKWIEIKTGIGASYYASSYSDDEAGTLRKDSGGLTMLLDFTFRPSFKYIDFMIINKLDIIIFAGYANPLYSGKLRVNFHPYLTWMSLYIEAGVQTFSYTGPPKDVNTAMFVWGIGISADIKAPSMFRKKVKEKSVEKTEQNENDKIEEFKKVKEGETVSFSNIIFYPDTDKIKEESFTVLDKIASVLNERKDILMIEIIGHTNSINKPDAELELSVKRADAVKNYLISKGIDPSRMKTAGYGSKFTKGASISESNRKVEIKIVDVK